MTDATHGRRTRGGAFRRDGGRLVGPEGLVGDAAPAQPAAARLSARAVDAHWGGDATIFTPLAGKRALDMGCGAGLLAEPLARLGAARDRDRRGGAR